MTEIRQGSQAYENLRRQINRLVAASVAGLATSADLTAEATARAAADALKVAKAGDTMTGPLVLPGAPTVDLHAATKKYVDDEATARTAAVALKVAKAGDTMTGPLVLSGAPTVDLHAATKKYVDDAMAAVAVADDSITNAKLANMAQATVKGRAAGSGTGDPIDLSQTQLTALVNPFTSALSGAVPAPVTPAGNFLRDDGTWAAASGGGSTDYGMVHALYGGM